MNSSIKILLIALSTLSGCTKPYTRVAPEDFAAYRMKRQFRTISPDGVVYRVKHVRNKPYADFSFWCEAFKKRMTDAGYRFIADTIKTDEQRAVYEFAAPVGNVDFVYLVSIIPVDKKIVIIEAAGDAVLFENRREAITQAMNKLEIR